jgi:DNA-binding transcriptional LysR family regulator
VSLRSTNLNLLPVLRALLRRASVSRASDDIGLSQPAVSSSLNRLRAIFGDPLLIQVGHSMRLTPRAKRLLPLLEDVYSGIEELLEENEFVLYNVERCFVVAAADYMALLLGPRLIETLNAVAPGISIRFANVPIDLNDQLSAGTIDVAIILQSEALARGMPCKKAGYEDRMVGTVAPGHPFASSPPRSMDELASHPHVGVDFGFPQQFQSSSVAPITSLMHRVARLSTSHLLVLPLLATLTNSVAIVPKTVADYVATLTPIKIFELPGPEILLDRVVVWSPLFDADPAHKWFRETLGLAMDGCLGKRDPNAPGSANTSSGTT